MKTIKDFPSYEENPCKPTGFKLVVAGGKRVKVSDEDSGAVITGKTLAATIPIDTKEYRKIYIEALDYIKLLSIPGLKLFCYILVVVKAKKDFVTLEREKIMEYCGYKAKSSYYDAILDLLEHKIIFRRVGAENLFFINVNFIFNGNREELVDKTEIYNNEK